MKCEPTSCARALVFCGALSDGCGATVDCGGCAAEQTCSREGRVSLCASPQAAPGLAWSRTWPGNPVTALATDSRENLVLMTGTERGAAPRKLDPRGQQLWAGSASSSWLEFYGLSVTPAGELLAWGWRQNEHDLRDAVAYRFDATGGSPRFLTQCTECSLGPYHEDTHGHVLSSVRTSNHAEVRFESTGTGDWSLLNRWGEADQDNPISFYPATFDTDGTVLAVGHFGEQVTFQGQPLGTAGVNSGLVAKFSPEGRLLWSRAFTQASVTFFEAVGSGSYVVAGRFRDSMTWEGGALSAARPGEPTPFLLVLDDRGQVSWARTLPLPLDRVARSPSGRIAVASQIFEPMDRRPHSVHLREYDLQGHLRWSHTWVPLTDSGQVVLHGLVWSEGSWVVGGSSKGVVSFNSTAEWVSPDSQGFLLKLQPTR